ncbi:MAG TPA: winged helix-turn-helix domain-containing protein [Solirubrobacterales bacterium]|nr:winged helix-turn-helix domain-containing protein [Solirubrobacterales bacterium]
MRIELSDQTYKRLLRQAESFEDTPESVLERLLDHAEEEGPSDSHGLMATQAILKKEGGLLPEGEYWLPILEILEEEGGKAQSRYVITELGDRIGSKLGPRDYDVLDMGEIRWQNRARFARLRMKEQGLISNESPRGIWEITDEGRRFLTERLPG